MKFNQLIIIALLCLVGMVACKKGETTNDQATEEEVVIRTEFGLPVDSFRIDTFVVKNGETLGGMLNKLGATQKQINQITLLPSSAFDVRTIRSGKTYYAFYQKDTTGVEKLQYYIYQASIREAVILHFADSIHIERQIKEITHKERSAQAVIESSLWNAMVGNNLPIELALELSEIYAWTIDFFGLQKGDSIRVYYDEQYVDTTCIGIGRIYAAQFYHGREWQEAYWFESENTRNYYDSKGNSMRKAFLKAPLSYKRISSGFTYKRLHPVHKVYKPHTGVDYAAPMGTPVMTIGDGVVLQREYRGGGGNTVKIKHNATYTTAYLHLSKFADGLKVGQHVKQGQVIGYVGSTGTSTGPHLDFRVWKNGTPIDPLKMDSPPAEPIPAQLTDTFNTIVEGYKAKLKF